MHCALAECDVRLGRDKVRKLLKACDLKTCCMRKLARATDSKHMLLGAKNLLTFYNQKRLSSALGNMSSTEFARQYRLKSAPVQAWALDSLSGGGKNWTGILHKSRRTGVHQR